MEFNQWLNRVVNEGQQWVWSGSQDAKSSDKCMTNQFTSFLSGTSAAASNF